MKGDLQFYENLNPLYPHSWLSWNQSSYITLSDRAPTDSWSWYSIRYAVYMAARGEWLSLLSPFPVITSSVVKIYFFKGTFSLCFSSSSLGVPLIFSLPSISLMPLYSQGFSLIILQCQIQSEGCNSQRDGSLAGSRTGGTSCACEIMLPQSGGNFHSSMVFYQ